MGVLVSGCGDSKNDAPPAAGSSGRAGGSVGGTAGDGGSGGSQGGRGGSGATSGGGVGGASPSGGGGQGGAGKGGTTAGTNAVGGTAGRASGGTSGADTMSGAGGEGAEGGAGATGECPAAVAGTWSLGDDNLYVVVESDCNVRNFCSIAEGIHSRGSVTNTVLLVDSVGGRPLAFAYSLSDDTLTLIDAGPNDEDLPLSRTDEALPMSCPDPAAPPRPGAVGVRCGVDGDCAVGLDCTARFFRERSICTMPCTDSCPDGAECVDGVPDYNSQPQPAHCFQPCQVSADCVPFGSECDAYESGGARHCF
jgi:hypothetical protein